jgi:hypothetical protein
MTLAIKTYGIKRKKTAAMVSWACLVMAFMPFLGIGLDMHSGKSVGLDYVPIILFWFVIWFPFSFVFRYWAKTAKLVISPNGIECDDIASLVGFSTDWENIRAVKFSKLRLVAWLDKPRIPINTLGRWSIRLSSVSPDIIEAYGYDPSNYIDLSSFVEHWKNGELRKDFEKYAPHLFNSESQLK